MKKKLVLLLSLVLTFSLLLSACGGTGNTTNSSGSATGTPSSQPSGNTEITSKYTIRLGTPTGGKHQQNVTMEEFKQRIEAASNGAITVELYPTSQLGTAPQMIEGLQNGTIEGVLIPSSYFASYAPAIAVLDLPFLFATDGSASQQAFDILNAGTSLDEYLYERGFTVGGWLLCANRYILSTFPVEKLSDLKNANIWSLPSPMLQNELKAYGAAPVSLDPGDIAVGLQNGTVSGVFNDPTFWFTQSLYESAKYMNRIPASAMTNCFFFSADWMDTLPQDIQDLILTTAKATVMEYEAPYMADFLANAEKSMIEAGAEVVEPSDALMDELKAAVATLHDTFKSTDANCTAIYDEISAKINAQ